MLRLRVLIWLFNFTQLLLLLVNNLIDIVTERESNVLAGIFDRFFLPPLPSLSVFFFGAQIPNLLLCVLISLSLFLSLYSVRLSCVGYVTIKS